MRMFPFHVMQEYTMKKCCSHSSCGKPGSCCCAGGAVVGLLALGALAWWLLGGCQKDGQCGRKDDKCSQKTDGQEVGPAADNSQS